VEVNDDNILELAQELEEIASLAKAHEDVGIQLKAERALVLLSEAPLTQEFERPIV